MSGTVARRPGAPPTSRFTWTEPQRQVLLFLLTILLLACGWAYGKASGAYGQMHCISLVLQGMRDGWIPEDQKAKYFDILRRLFYYFFQTYLDQEHGFLDVRDEERTAYSAHTTRMANFDGL